MRIVWAGVCAVAFLALGGAQQASAHAQLAVASPAPAQILTQAPTQISLTFDDALIPQPGANQVRLTDASGRIYSGAVSLQGATLSSRLRPLTHYGRYRVTYRVLSADGHPVSASYDFYWRKSAKHG